MKTKNRFVKSFTASTVRESSKRQKVRPLPTIYLLLILLLALSGCGLFAADEEADGPVVIRTVHPTFTPTVATTPVPVQPTQAPLPEQQSSSGEMSAVETTGAKAVINSPLVNARTGPGISFDVIDEVERGEEFDIVGVSPDREWWQICCVNGEEAWVTSEFVDTLGLVDSVPVIGAAVAQEVPTAPAAATAAPPTATPAPSIDFALETQEQFPETGLVRVFLYVYSGNSALEGFSLRVTKDGTELPVTGTSFGGQPAFTWPFQDPRQRFQNFKIEFPDTPAQGVWQVQLIDSSGATVGPSATFTLSANDPQQELYVRYAQR